MKCLNSTGGLDVSFQVFSLLASGSPERCRPVESLNAIKPQWRIYALELLHRYLDFVTVMSYDYKGGWDPTTGFNSPLYSTAGDNFTTVNRGVFEINACVSIDCDNRFLCESLM